MENKCEICKHWKQYSYGFEAGTHGTCKLITKGKISQDVAAITGGGYSETEFDTARDFFCKLFENKM